jgi:hypothetical protein
MFQRFEKYWYCFKDTKKSFLVPFKQYQYFSLPKENFLNIFSSFLSTGRTKFLITLYTIDSSPQDKNSSQDHLECTSSPGAYHEFPINFAATFFIVFLFFSARICFNKPPFQHSRNAPLCTTTFMA